MTVAAAPRSLPPHPPDLPSAEQGRLSRCELGTPWLTVRFAWDDILALSSSACGVDVMIKHQGYAASLLRSSSTTSGHISFRFSKTCFAVE